MNEINKKSNSVSLSSEDLSKRKEKLVSQVLACPAAKKVYDLTCTIPSLGKMSGAWEVQFIQGQFPASFNSDHRYVRLDPTKTEEENLGSYLFELINITQTKRFNKVIESATEGTIGKDDYAREVENIEFDTAIQHHEIASQAIKECDWPKSIDVYKNNASIGFEKFWETSKTGEHSEFCRNQFKVIRTRALMQNLSPIKPPPTFSEAEQKKPTLNADLVKKQSSKKLQ
jgi:hypothetical protein